MYVCHCFCTAGTGIDVRVAECPGLRSDRRGAIPVSRYGTAMTGCSLSSMLSLPVAGSRSIRRKETDREVLAGCLPAVLGELCKTETRCGRRVWVVLGSLKDGMPRPAAGDRGALRFGCSCRCLSLSSGLRLRWPASRSAVRVTRTSVLRCVLLRALSPRLDSFSPRLSVRRTTCAHTLCHPDHLLHSMHGTLLRS